MSYIRQKIELPLIKRHDTPFLMESVEIKSNEDMEVVTVPLLNRVTTCTKLTGIEVLHIAEFSIRVIAFLFSVIIAIPEVIYRINRPQTCKITDMFCVKTFLTLKDSTISTFYNTPRLILSSLKKSQPLWRTDYHQIGEIRNSITKILKDDISDLQYINENITENKKHVFFIKDNKIVHNSSTKDSYYEDSDIYTSNSKNIELNKMLPEIALLARDFFILNKLNKTQKESFIPRSVAAYKDLVKPAMA